MSGLLNGYMAGLVAAENGRLNRQMWDLATRATRRQQAPVDDRAVLIDQVAQLQAQLQHAVAEREELRALADANYRAWCVEFGAHRITKATLEAVEDMWTPPVFDRGPRSQP